MGMFDWILARTENPALVALVLGAGFIFGLIFLVKGSDIFIDGAASLARKKGISEHTIGLTLVAFATSVPELFVSVFAASTGKSDIAIGNVVGSNMANICLVLAISTIIMSLKTSKMVKQNTLIMLGVTLLLYLFILAGHDVNRMEGIVFLLIYVAFLVYIFKFSEEAELDMPKKATGASLEKDLGSIVIGLIGVTLGANLLIDSAVEMASRANISEVIIGLTIVSIGTSLPELASSVTAASKGKHGISIGNVIGSNILNIVLVLGTTAVIAPVSVGTTVVNSTMPLLILISVFMLVMVRKDLRKELGYGLLVVYAFFLGILALGSL